MTILMRKMLDAIYPIQSLVDKKWNSFQLKIVSSCLLLYRNRFSFSHLLSSTFSSCTIAFNIIMVSVT